MDVTKTGNGEWKIDKGGNTGQRCFDRTHVGVSCDRSAQRGGLGLGQTSNPSRVE